MAKKKQPAERKKLPVNRAEYIEGSADATALLDLGLSERFLRHLTLHLGLCRKVDRSLDYSYCEGINDTLFGKRN